MHRNASLLSVVFLAIHVVTTIVDPDANVQLAAVVFPFTSHWAPFWVGLGALALDGATIHSGFTARGVPFSDDSQLSVARWRGERNA